MSALILRLTVLLMLFCFAGCQTLQVLQEPTAAQIAQEVQVGDTVLITARNGRRYALQVTVVGGDALLGVSPKDGKTYKAGYETVHKLEMTTISATNTAGAVGLGVGTYLVIGALIAMAMAAFGEALGEAMACIVTFGAAEECD